MPVDVGATWRDGAGQPPALARRVPHEPRATSARPGLSERHPAIPRESSIGAVIEVGALLAAAILAGLVRERQPAFRRTLAGAACLGAANRRMSAVRNRYYADRSGLNERDAHQLDW